MEGLFHSFEEPTATPDQELGGLDELEGALEAISLGEVPELALGDWGAVAIKFLV